MTVKPNCPNDLKESRPPIKNETPTIPQVSSPTQEKRSSTLEDVKYPLHPVVGYSPARAMASVPHCNNPHRLSHRFRCLPCKEEFTGMKEASKHGQEHHGTSKKGAKKHGKSSKNSSEQSLYRWICLCDGQEVSDPTTIGLVDGIPKRVPIPSRVYQVLDSMTELENHQKEAHPSQKFKNSKRCTCGDKFWFERQIVDHFEKMKGLDDGMVHEIVARRAKAAKKERGKSKSS